MATNAASDRQRSRARTRRNSTNGSSPDLRTGGTQANRLTLTLSGCSEFDDARAKPEVRGPALRSVLFPPETKIHHRLVGGGFFPDFLGSLADPLFCWFCHRVSSLRHLEWRSCNDERPQPGEQLGPSRVFFLVVICRDAHGHLGQQTSSPADNLRAPQPRWGRNGAVAIASAVPTAAPAMPAAVSTAAPTGPSCSTRSR
jgi:hypothetical protein